MKALALTMALPVGLAVLVTLAACGSKKEAPPSTPAATSTEAAAPAAPVAAAAMNPKPVNFAAGDFKYDTNGNGTPGEIEDIMTIIRDGTAKHSGSALMAPWPQLSEAQREAVAEHVKAFHTG